MTPPDQSRPDGTTRGARGPLIASSLATFGGLIAVGLLAFFWIFRATGKAAGTVDLGRTTSAAEKLTLLAVATGVISMASIEFLKRMLPVRGWFHEATLARLLGSSVLDALVARTTPRGSRLIFLDAPIEQVAAQFNSAIDQIVDGLAADSLNLQWYRDQQQATYSTSGPLVKALLAINGVAGVELFIAADSQSAMSLQTRPAVSAAPARDDDFMEMVAHVRRFVDSGLDSVQLTVGYQWRRLVRSAAALVSAVAAFGLTALSHAGWVFVFTGVSASLLLGGFFSWFARDLTAGVERWRR